MSPTGLIVLDRHSVSRPASVAAGGTSLQTPGTDFSLLLQATQATPLTTTLAAGTVLRPLAAPAGASDLPAAPPQPVGSRLADLPDLLSKLLPTGRQSLTLDGEALPPAGEALPLWHIDPSSSAVAIDLSAVEGQGVWQGIPAPTDERGGSATGTDGGEPAGLPPDESMLSPATAPRDTATQHAMAAVDTLKLPQAADHERPGARLVGEAIAMSAMAMQSADAKHVKEPGALIMPSSDGEVTELPPQPGLASTIMSNLAPALEPATQATTLAKVAGPVDQDSSSESGLAAMDIAERMRSWRQLFGALQGGIEPGRASDLGAAASGMSVATGNLALGNELLLRQTALPGQLQAFAEQLQATLPTVDPATAAPNVAADEAALPLPTRLESSTGQARPLPTAAFNPHTFNQTLGHAFDEPQWGESFARHISLLTGQRVSSAEVQLDPPELGSLLVRINIVGEQASISFSSPHLQVRDSIEQHVDKLQNMLNEQGLDLVDVNVSDQSPRRQGTPGRSAEGRAADDLADSTEQALQALEGVVTRHLGLVDTFI